MNRHKRTNHILEIALKIFARDGYADTTISKLVDEAGMSRGTFYLYFKSREDVFDALLDCFLEPILNLLGELSVFKLIKDRRFDEALCRMVSQEMASHLCRYSKLGHLIVSESNTIEPIHRKKINAYQVEFGRRLSKIFSAGMQANVLESVNSQMLATCLIGSIKEFMLVCDPLVPTELATNIFELFSFVFKSLVFKEQARSVPLSQPANEPLYLRKTLPV